MTWSEVLGLPEPTDRPDLPGLRCSAHGQAERGQTADRELGRDLSFGAGLVSLARI